MPGSGSVTFKGASSVYETSNTPTASQVGWTLEAWINPSSASQTGMVIFDGDEGGQGGAANGYGFGLFGASNGNSAGDCLDGLFEGVTVGLQRLLQFQPGQWYFVAETCNSGLHGIFTSTAPPTRRRRSRARCRSPRRGGTTTAATTRNSRATAVAGRGISAARSRMPLSTAPSPGLH